MLKIKEIREREGFTQDQVASGVGISKRSYINYEKNETDIPFKKLQDIATFLKVDITELFESSKSASFVTKEKSNKNSNINLQKQNVQNMLLNDGSLEDMITQRIIDRLSPLFTKIAEIDEYMKTTDLLEGLVGKMMLEKEKEPDKSSFKESSSED